METQTAQPKAPESKLGAKPESKDDLKSLSHAGTTGQRALQNE